MTTHFSNGVTNVRGKDGDTSLFSGIKQPLITGGYGQEVAYQNDWVIYNSGDWDVTSGGGSDYQLVDYAGGWLRLGDDAPAAGEITGLSGKEVWNYNANKQWWYETRIAMTDVTEANIFVGFADNAFVDPATVPTDCIGFSHLEDTTTIQFVISKDGTSTSTNVLSTSGGSAITFADSTVATQSATVGQIPSNSVRLGFRFIPAGQEGVTTGTYRVYYNGNPVLDQTTLTYVPDDIGLAVVMGTNTKGTTTTNAMIDYVKVLGERVV